MEQSQTKPKFSLKAKVQKLGSTLSSMVMPNIGALIAWGVLTALFIPDGYLPNERLATMVGPMLSYLIPILIGYTGGKVIASDRGAVVGAIATMGVIVGAPETPMLLGAMIMGPLGGWAIKTFDKYTANSIRAGFEMLVNNFSAGLIGFALALFGFWGIGPVVSVLTNFMAAGVEIIVNAHLIPLANILIEPAKILFLNNAINHGILTPLGTEQVAEAGKSILYLLEANPGPGLGVLLAFTFFGKGSAKSSAPGAIIIHFLGGIHEIYFPYVMMKPLLFLAVIAGGVSGTFTFQLLGAGLRAPSSPGSIVAIMAMTPFNSIMSVVSVVAGILVATVVSFLVAMVILKSDHHDTEDNFAQKVKETQEAKLSSKGLSAQTVDGIQQIIFACDAGMGSSAMGASLLRKKVREAGLDQDVTNLAINNLTDQPNTLIVTQQELQERAKQKAPHGTFVAVENFLNSPKYDEIVALLSHKDVPQATKKAETLDHSLSILADKVASIKTILLVHDARKGSATMGQKIVKDLLENVGLTLPVKTVGIEDLSKDLDHETLVITLDRLSSAVEADAPHATHITVENFVNTPVYEKLVAELKSKN